MHIMLRIVNLKRELFSLFEPMIHLVGACSPFEWGRSDRRSRSSESPTMTPKLNSPTITILLFFERFNRRHRIQRDKRTSIELLHLTASWTALTRAEVGSFSALKESTPTNEKRSLANRFIWNLIWRNRSLVPASTRLKQRC